MAGYSSDRDGSTYARDDLAKMLQNLSGPGAIRSVTLIGHSMGGWLVLEALRQLRFQGQDTVIDPIQVMLAAPDIDVDVFRRQSEVIGLLQRPIVLLVSTDDKALAVSRLLAGGRQRVGAVDVNNSRAQAIAQKANVTVVDISSLEGTNRSNHDRFVTFAASDALRSARKNGSTDRLRRAGALVFNAAGSALSKPFMLAGSALAGE